MKRWVSPGSAGAPGVLNITSEANEYGSVAVGSSAARTFTVANIGGTSVEITKSKPPIGGEFAATTSLSEASTLAAGESRSETVVFSPTVAGEATGAWAITGTDTTGPHQVDFSGVGTVASPEPGLAQVPPLISQLTGNIGTLSSTETAAPIAPAAVLASRALTASSSGAVGVRVRCPTGVVRCTGTVTLRTFTAVLASVGGTSGPSGSSKPAILTLAKGPFTALAGQTKTVKLHLVPRARTLLQRVRSLRARATILARDPRGASHTTRTTVTLRAPRR